MLAIQQLGGGVALGQGDVDGSQFLLHRHHGGEDALHLVKQGAGGLAAGVLLHIADGGVAVFHHRAAVVGVLPHQDAQEGGLAAAVVTHETDLVVLAHLEGKVGEQRTLAEIFIQLLYAEIGHGVTSLS